MASRQQFPNQLAIAPAAGSVAGSLEFAGMLPPSLLAISLLLSRVAQAKLSATALSEDVAQNRIWVPTPTGTTSLLYALTDRRCAGDDDWTPFVSVR
jgi:hypothetical protein